MSRAHVAIGLLLALLNAAGAQTGTDIDRLQGTWKLVDQTFAGSKTPERSLELIFAGDKVAYQTETYFWEGMIKLDASAQPKTLDIHSSPYDRTMRCLYRLEGDKLIVALPNGFDGPRPTDLVSAKGDQTKFVAVFARVATTKPLSAEAAEQIALKRARLECGASLHRLVVAMHKYIDKHGHFPPAATTDRSGKPLLSWRVTLLPFLGEQALYEQFRQDEPWDSQHNRKLLAHMPRVYASVGKPPTNAHATFYQVFVGDGCLFEPGRNITIDDVEDGTSDTIAIIAAGSSVPWTKPADLACVDGRPLPSLAGGMVRDGLVSFATADASVHIITNTVEEKLLRPFLLRSTGDVKDLQSLKK